MSYFLTPWNNNFDDIYASGNIITEQYFVGNGAFLTGATFTPPAVSSSDIRGNIIGSYANVSNIIANVGGNIANVRFTMDGNITTGAYIQAGFFVGDGSGLTGITSTPAAISTTDVRGNIIGSYANVSNIIANVGGNIGNVRFTMDGNITTGAYIQAGFFVGDGSGLTGITSTPAAISTTDVRGNIIGSYANVSNIISNVGGNIGNVVFLGGNVAVSGQINVLGNVVSSFMIGDNRGNIIGSYANVSNIISNVGGNIGNVVFLGGNVAASGQINVLGNVVSSFMIGDNRGNIIGSYANVSNIISNVGGNIGNVVFLGGNVAVSGQINVLGNVVSSFMIGDNRGNIIGSYANVSNIIANVGGNIANVRFTMDGNITTGAYIQAGFFVGDGSGLTGITSTPAAIASIDVRGNIIGSYANVSNIIANVGGNIANVRFTMDGNITTGAYINAGFFVGDGSGLTGITSTPAAIASIDVRGNIIGSYANVSNIIANVGGNIANVRFTMDGNITTGAYIQAGFFVGDGSGLTGITSTPAAISTTDVRGNIIGSYANVSNIIANVGGNIGNVVFLGGNVAVSGQINVLGNVVSSFMIGDNRGNIIGSYANVSNIISNVGGNIGNVVFLGGNVAVSGQINVLGNVVSSFMIGDNRGNIIGSYANVSNIIANVGGNISNVRFLGGNVAVSGQINVLGNVVSSFMIGDNRGNIIGSYANVSNIIANVGGNIGNVRFLGGNVAVSGQINVLGNVVSSFMIGDNRGNIIGSYANVSNIIANVGGNIGNVRFTMDGNITTGAYINAGFFVGDGSQLTGVISTLPAIASTDVRGNIIGSYANVSNIIANVGGNIANVRFTMDGNITTGAYIQAGFFVGDGSGLTGVTSTLPAISTTDVRGNIIGSYANVSNIISNVGGNIGNVVFLGGNVAVSGQINVLGNVVSSFMIGDNRGNIIGSYANVSNIISNVGGNIANVVFLGGNVAVSGQINVLGNVVSSFMIGDNRGNIIGSYANVSNIISNVGGNIGNVMFLGGNVAVSGQINVLGNVVSSFMIGDNRGNIIGSYANVSNVFANVSINVFDNVGTLPTTANLFNSVSTSAVVPNGWKHMSCVTRGNTVFQLTGDGSVASNVSSNVNLMNLYSTNVGYQSVMLQILTNRAQNPNYSFIECDNSDGATIVAPFSVNGQGNIDSTSSISVLDGTTGAIRWRAANTGTMRANVSLNTFNLMNLHATGASFSSDIVSLQTTRTASSLFNFINCSTNDGATPVLTVDGVGNVTANGALTVDTAGSYGAAPLANNINSVSTSGTTSGHGHISCVTRGNAVFRVDVGGTITANVPQVREAANLYVTAAAYTSTVLSLQALRGSSTAFNFIRCAANDGDDPQFTVNGAGSVKSINTNTGSPDVMNVTSLNTNFRGVLFKGYIAAGGYTGQQFISCVNGTSGNVFRVRGDGQIYASSNVISTNADYAEFFEWEDGNPMSEDRRCKTVTLVDDGKIRIARPEDDPLEIFGIVSAHPTIIGDAAWNEWSGKYIRNKFGDKTILNPEYDPTAGYIPREDRKEWDPIGLVGKLRVLPDQKVNPSWRFLRTITSDDGITHEYLLTSGVNSNVMAELTSLKSELATIKAHLGI